MGSRQDVLLAQSGVDQANAHLVAAQLRASEANVAVAGARTAALDAQGIAQQAGQVLTAATQARADAEARLAAAGDGASAAVRAEVDRALAAERAATTAQASAADKAQTLADAYWTATSRYQQIVLDVGDLTAQVTLFQASLERAKAQVPLAAAELVRARADAATRAQASAFLTAKAWQDYLNYDRAYWRGRGAMEALAMPSTASRADEAAGAGRQFAGPDYARHGGGNCREDTVADLVAERVVDGDLLRR